MHAPPWAVVVVRHGRLAVEWYGVPALPTTTFDVWSCTKSFTGIGFGMLLDDAAYGKPVGAAGFSLDSPACAFLPEGIPLSDPRKKAISIRHLLTMTSGIPGEDHGMIGIAPGEEGGPFEVALGLSPDRFGRSAARLFAEPGSAWEYSDNAFAQLSLVFAAVAGRELRDYLDERLFAPLGIRNYGWDWQGGGGDLGPHTNAHTGLRLTARDIARVGYLLLHRGRWEGRSLISEDWLGAATETSQPLKPSYGLTFWVNRDRSLWPSLPSEAFGMQGYACNRCYVAPSLDLVIARLGYGPASWADGAFLDPIVSSIID